MQHILESHAALRSCPNLRLAIEKRYGCLPLLGADEEASSSLDAILAQAVEGASRVRGLASLDNIPSCEQDQSTAAVRRSRGRRAIEPSRDHAVARCRSCGSARVRNHGGGSKVDKAKWGKTAKNRFQCHSCGARWQEILGVEGSYSECSVYRKKHTPHACMVCFNRNHGTFWKKEVDGMVHKCFDDSLPFEEWRIREIRTQRLKEQNATA